jgi:hypothetical protein
MEYDQAGIWKPPPPEMWNEPWLSNPVMPSQPDKEKGRNEPDSGFCGTKICGLNLILDTRRCALLLQGATLIDKDDGISGYFQVALHPDSQHLTGVYTPLGVRVFNVMPLGINVTPTTGPS